MFKRETPSEVLQGYIKAIQTSLIDPLVKNQTKLSFQQELRESKRFQEAEIKLKEFQSSYNQFKESNFLCDRVIEALRKVHATRVATRMTMFLEKGELLAIEDSDEVKTSLAPFVDFIKPLEDVRRLQTTMMNQGKIKKMPLPYDEVTATLNEVGALLAKMPAILTDGIASFSEKLDQVA